MRPTIRRLLSFAAVAALHGGLGCTRSEPADSGPAGTGHTVHLQEGTFAAAYDCAACHSPTGFAVDFSQDPLVHDHGGTYDPTSGTCAVYCHGSFTFGQVSGAATTPRWSDNTPMSCTSCHGMPPTGHPALAGTVDARTCNACHAQTVDSQGLIAVANGTHIDGKAQTTGVGCTGCHGDAGRVANLAGTDANLTSSPPQAPASAPGYATGAHLGHVNPTTASYLMPPVACAACHPVPTDSTHATSPPPRVVVFGSLAIAGGAVPTWSPVTAGCSASYCHGNFAFGTVTGSNATPAWTDTTALTCGSCHGMPPTGHPAYSGAQDAPSCHACHPQTVNADGTIMLAGGHLNGIADGGACGTCHGLPPPTGRHTEEDHLRLRCDACHPTGYASTTTVAPSHENGVVDLGSQAGYSCGLTGCPAGTVGTCTNRCHTQPQSWRGQ